MNQLTQRYTGPSWGGSVSGEERRAYAYDANGFGWSESEEWVYEWNPRDQMTRAIKYAGGSADNAMEENIFSKYFERDDGLNLLRVDELYDSDSDGLDGDDLAANAWRALWVGTYRPGSLGALLHKTVYESPSATSPPS